MQDTLRKVWDLFTQNEKRKALIMLVLAILMAITEMLGVLSIMPFLSVLSRPDVIHEQSLLKAIYRYLNLDNERDFIIILGLFSITIVLLSSIFKTIAQHVLNRFVQLQRYTISNRLLSNYLNQPYEFFLNRNSAELCKNVLAEVDQIVANLINPLSQLIAQGIIVLAMGLVILVYDPFTALIILFIIAGLYGGIYSLVRQRLRRIGKEIVITNRDRYQSCNEAFGGIRDIKISHAQEVYLERYDLAARTHARHTATSETLSQAPLYIVEAVGYTGLILLALSLLFRRNDIAEVLPALGMYSFAAYRLLPASQIIYRGFARLRFASAALDNIHHDLFLFSTDQPVNDHRLVPQQKIYLKNINFAYPSEPNKIIFNDYSVSITANITTGILGKSGAGKSTLMDLLLGLLKPQSGHLQIDDTVINSSNNHAWHTAIGYVPQHIYLSDTSVAANIALGVPKEKIDIEALHKAAKIAQIHDFIVHELPQAYETFLGEKGIRLSGGQRQRIGIARALYRDPPVLFMDEATSALDIETERAVNEAILNLSGKKTIVVIAHKEESLRNCQEIIKVTSIHEKSIDQKQSGHN